ncbi:MAG: membrane dipeptidase [Caldilineaceae bacterium]|nr:membrane dipeptidase [Caldilineaceae bacterium]
MLIVDAHLDLAWNALQWNRDLRQSVYTIRTQEAGLPEKARTLGTVALPELQAGRVALAFATMLARSTGQTVAGLDYGSAAQAYGAAQGQLAYYRALAQQQHVRIVEDAVALDAHLAAWQAWETTASVGNSAGAPPLGLVLSMEGADPILEPADLGNWHAAGLRLLGPAHYGPGRYAGGTGTELGLTTLGQALVDEMAQLGMALDVTHLSDPAFWQALDLFDGPVLASHNNCRALVPHQRQFSDDQLKALIARNSVIGVAFDAWMLAPGWLRGVSRPESMAGGPVTIATVVDHIDYLCQLAGNSRHAAIGTDLDGGFGREQSPHDLDTIADLQRIPALLADRGYREGDIAAIMHGNWCDFLRRAWAD